MSRRIDNVSHKSLRAAWPLNVIHRNTHFLSVISVSL